MIDALHDAIKQRLAAALPDLDVQFYPDLGARVSLPLLVLELAEFDTGTDPGTGELALIATFQARLVCDPNQAGAELAIRQLAAHVAAQVHAATNFGQPVTPAKLRQIGPDGFRADLDGYLVWLVEWVHEMDIGEPSDITLPSFVPREVVWSADGDTEAVTLP
ncbi:hypothetical protein ACFPAG_07910 [Vogesella sp. GCM10023246]|uniref:Uncharacterized protein n=1 Tax=Vogesella oryzagri TaxID=3160864 RepID=A0ABV1M3C2_9NEIS